MSENNEAVAKERDPNYKKKAQWFALVAIGLLCVTLIISVFAGGGKRRSDQEKQPLPIDQGGRQGTRDSERDLQERIQQERMRRLREMEKQPQPDQQHDRMQALVERKEQDRRHERQIEQQARLSIEEEFKENEKKRALNARRSRFNLRRQQHNENQGQAMPAGNLVASNSGKDLTPFLQEQRRVEQEIQRLEKLQQQAGSGDGSPATGSGFFGASDQTADPQEQITVGRPASEAPPKAGQRLVPTGTTISAVLDQKLMSDYVGPFRAMVTSDVYDVTNNYVIIPKGSRITGNSLRITNVNEPIQARMGLAVKWVVLPDGKRISFEKRSAALDSEGVPAIKDEVNYHFMAQFLGVMAYAVLSHETSREGSGMSNDTTFEGDLGDSIREQFAPLAAKYLNLVPTITLNIGTPMTIFLEDDLYAYPWDSLSEKLYRASTKGY